MEQKSPEWYEKRLGNFTGSEFWKLLTNGKAKDKLFGDTALTYIDNKVAEIITNGTCLDYGFQGSKETEWGNYCEPKAKEAFTQKTGFSIIGCGYIQIDERFGCSPDGSTEDAIIEIKCPYNTINHIAHFELKNSADLLELSKAYYTQMQVEMIALKRDFGYFVSYDPRCSDLLQLKILKVNRDEDFIKLINERYKAALKILNDKIDNLFELATNNTF